MFRRQRWIFRLSETGSTLQPLRFTTLQARFLVPLLGTALIAAAAVAVVSGEMGRRWATQEVKARYAGIESTISESAFPLTPSVLDSLAGLTGTQWMTLSSDDRILGETLGLAADDLDELQKTVSESNRVPQNSINLAGRNYLAFRVVRLPNTRQIDRVASVLVLFNRDRIDESGRRAALLPLATGLSTIVLLTTVMVAITRSVVKRLVRLKQSVQYVAAGDFNTTVTDDTADEIGQLGIAVDSMSQQLSRLWDQVYRQQSAKLLHQVAGGMAHQLRNTLTGSRMAIELHRQSCPSEVTEDVDVAIEQMEVAEDYVRRLLMLGCGQQEQPQPTRLRVCFDHIRSSHAAVAKHLRVDLRWQVKIDHVDCLVGDGRGFTAAISNLILNAFQAGTRVDVSVWVAESVADPGSKMTCIVEVKDDGSGIEPSMADELFEPFVTSKPEGMGLGLPLVKRVAEELDGTVTTQRQDDWTVFRFACCVQKIEGNLDPLDAMKINQTVRS